MKNYYDKVLFVLGLLLLGLGVAYFFLQGGIPTKAAPAVTQAAPTGSDYQAVPTTAVTAEMVEWGETPDQYAPDGKGSWDDAVMKELGLTDETKIPLERQYPLSDLWYYGVFTPPKIWWDPTLGWTAESPKEQKPPPPPFALHFEGIRERLYRLQLQGYVGGATPFLQMQDTTNNTFFNINMKVSGANAEEAVKVTGFSEKVIKRPDGTLHRVGVITILDERTNQTLTLTEGVPLTMAGEKYYLLQTDNPLPPQDWDVTKVGETLDVGDADFKITALDPNAPTVTVVKTQPGQDVITKTLTPTNPNPPAQTTDPAPAPTAAGGAM